MKCEACNYKEPIEESEYLKCTLTEEEHEPSDDCNCERIRVRRDNEARLLAERDAAAKTLTALKDKLTKPTPDIEYVYSVLHEISEEVESDKLEELIKYLEAFI